MRNFHGEYNQDIPAVIGTGGDDCTPAPGSLTIDISLSGGHHPCR
jgi:hypothetical protein